MSNTRANPAASRSRSSAERSRKDAVADGLPVRRAGVDLLDSSASLAAAERTAERTVERLGLRAGRT